MLCLNYKFNAILHPTNIPTGWRFFKKRLNFPEKLKCASLARGILKNKDSGVGEQFIRC